jgi:Asp-tRNA(Asn)/Glu-tRNA(Gln) amidotransferase A subunit family amidase
MRNRTLASEAVANATNAVEELDELVQAWAAFDPVLARAEGRRADACDGSLRGLAIGVKDIFDTAEWPTSYGSPIYTGHRPPLDAVAVSLVRNAGAACLGKTVTAEFAGFHPGPTTNPHRLSHTPGGSSSGSAAAVAAGMVDVALGTQTAGSVIRPASFCGVFGFKATFGAVPTEGIKLIAPSLDTVGWFARNTANLEALRLVLTARPALQVSRHPPTLGLVRTEQWEMAEQASQEAVEEAAHRARGAGAVVVEIDLPAALEKLSVEHAIVQRFEMARALAWEYRCHRDLLSDGLRKLIEQGQQVEVSDYDEIQNSRSSARALAASLFDTYRVDAFLTPAAVGEAPKGLSSTGDPRFGRLWTILGLPAVSIPGLRGAIGLPIGVQMVGPVDSDALLIDFAGWLAALLSRP